MYDFPPASLLVLLFVSALDVFVANILPFALYTAVSTCRRESWSFECPYPPVVAVPDLVHHFIVTTRATVQYCTSSFDQSLISSGHVQLEGKSAGKYHTKHGPVPPEEGADGES